MRISIQCATVASLIALGLLSESQTFALAFCNGGSAAVLRSSARAGNMMPSSWSGRHRSMRTARVGRHRKVALMMSEMEEDYPSDTGDDRFSAGAGVAERERVAFADKDTPEVAQLKLDLLRIAALTGRGQLATKAERCRVEDVIWELEMRTPIEETATSEALLGRWALVYASEDATRSSPFFWAFRKATEGLKVPFGGVGGGGLDGSVVASTIFAVTDSLPSKSVGEAVQTITEKEIKSEVEIFAGASAGSDKRSGSEGPNTFPSFRSVMTTTSEITDAKGKGMKLKVAKTQVRKSALGRLLKPLFNLDDIEFKTDSLLTPLKEGSTEVLMTTTYLDGLLRVSRNEQGQVFVFARADDGELR
ncbi:unnamed protein product [Pylaiella littoralis]